MVFKYDQNKLKDYRKNGILTVLPFFCVLIFTVLPMVYITMSMQGFENTLFITFWTFIMVIISTGIGILIGYIKAKKEFESYQIECNDKMMIISSKMLHKKIKTEQINKIFKDNKNNIYIVANKINKIKILHFIENITEFENYLSGICKMEQQNIKYNILQYVPLAFFIALMYISKTGNLQLYLIIAIIVLLTTVYSLIKLILDQIKFRHKIIAIIVNGFIIYSVIRGIYSVIVYLKK
jgi:hypothetical protein